MTQVKRRIVYSDKKRKAKLAPEYSVLKPDTNSDSDSEKSKGARWSSAREVTNQIRRKVRKRIDDDDEKERILKERESRQKITRRVVKTDS